jgi:hypothetical protein
MTETAGVHQLIEPGPGCHTLRHDIRTRTRTTGPGQWTYCHTCSLGYQLAKEQGLTDQAADDFVRSLRNPTDHLIYLDAKRRGSPQ